MSLKIVLGFDFGMKHIGVAVGQTISMTSQTCTSIAAREGIPYWNSVDVLLKRWQPDALIVGVPVHLNGEEHAITQAARHFIQQLKGRFKLPVHAAEERLTSVEARARLFEHGGYRSLSKQAVDGLAAKLILEGWLSEYSLSQLQEN